LRFIAMHYLIDTHCHITNLSCDEISGLIIRAKEASVHKMICVGASDGIQSSFDALSLSQKYPEVYCSIGIHPHDADTCEWSDALKDLITHDKVLAVGETGLDFFKAWSDFKKQEALFRTTIRLAKEFSKPLIIHCRDAFPDCVKILREENGSDVGGVFHCFSGTAGEASQLSEINFLVSYTGTITFKNAHAVRKEAAKIPLSQIMLETDAPYMAPEPYRGKKSEPAHVSLIRDVLAEVHQVSPEHIAEVTTQNAYRLFHGLS
jgi:TatD DNase family protein